MLPATKLFGLWLFGILYLVLEVRPPAHCRAFTHFLSVTSRLKCASDLGSGIARAPTLSEYSSHSTSRVSGSSAAILAHSSAFSLRSTPLCVRNHLISMAISGLALRSAPICLLAWTAYFWPGLL